MAGQSASTQATYTSVLWADNTGVQDGPLPTAGVYLAAPLLVDGVEGDTTSGYSTLTFNIGQHNQSDRARIALLYDLGMAKQIGRITARVSNAKFYTQSICAIRVYRGASIAGLGFAGSWQTNFTKAALAFDSTGTDSDFTVGTTDTSINTASRYWAVIAEIQLQGNFSGYQDNFILKATDYRLYESLPPPCLRPAAPIFSAGASGSIIKLTGNS